jgi:methyl-accepting chemotaxis protein
MFKAMTIRTQIIGGFGVVLLCTFAVGAAGLWGMHRLGEQIEEVQSRGALGTQHLATIESAVWQLRYGIAQYVGVSDPNVRKQVVAEGPKWSGIAADSAKRYGAIGL